MQHGHLKHSISATVTTLLLGATAVTATAQMGAEPPPGQDPGMQQEDPGMQQQPGMGQEDPGMGQQPGMEQQDPGMQQQDPGMAPPEPQRSTFSDQQIERFVDAYLEIIEIQEDYTSDIQQADGGEQARELQEQANDDMVRAIEDNGLSVPEYSEIANAMDMDPDLRDEVSAKIRENE
ncbi:hypothetical protein HH1059_12860 [Halorhodospira halochloris]|uniref:DUF4168 domain-containing protein n=1 Tax=Halorhodospira halochloris TaxID=1052 RepID=A0A0X8X9R7_HALHR|nr:DUF4168 domain-containing protein [Halorhodospira halochloris]BAU57994.2 hypothetical protein HH1059_12860 [Halorhodospira halochloris]